MPIFLITSTNKEQEVSLLGTPDPIDIGFHLQLLGQKNELTKASWWKDTMQRVQGRLVLADDWWDELDLAGQKQYLEEHPGSRMQITKEDKKNSKTCANCKWLGTCKDQFGVKANDAACGEWAASGTSDLKGAAKDLGKSHKSFEKQTTKLFGSANPGMADMQKVRTSNPAAYKEWSDASLAIKKQERTTLELHWKKLGSITSMQDASKVRSLMEELGIKNSTIPEGYEGKVSLSFGTPLLLNFHTKRGLILGGTPGRECRMNPNYDSDKDDSYYCTAKPAGFSEALYDFYTLENRRRAQSAIFAANLEVSKVLPTCTPQWTDDLKSNDPTIATSALLVLLAHATCGRMGNKGSAKNGKYGLHNLLNEHLKVGAKSATLTYVGKDGVNQEHKITDPILVEQLRRRKEATKKGQPLFGTSEGATNPIDPAAVNKYLNGTGFPGTFHRFRHYRANTLVGNFVQGTKDAYDKKGTVLTTKQVVEQFNQTVQQVASTLGNQPAASLSNYIDPALVYDYFKYWEVDPPKTVKTVLAKSYLNIDPDTSYREE